MVERFNLSSLKSVLYKILHQWLFFSNFFEKKAEKVSMIGLFVKFWKLQAPNWHIWVQAYLTQ